MTLDEMLAKIRAAMAEREMTSAAVAEAVGKSAQEVGQWLIGKHRPSLHYLDALARAVGLEVTLCKVKPPRKPRKVGKRKARAAASS